MLPNKQRRKRALRWWGAHHATLALFVRSRRGSRVQASTFRLPRRPPPIYYLFCLALWVSPRGLRSPRTQPNFERRMRDDEVYSSAPADPECRSIQASYAHPRAVILIAEMDPVHTPGGVTRQYAIAPWPMPAPGSVRRSVRRFCGWPRLMTLRPPASKKASFHARGKPISALGLGGSVDDMAGGSRREMPRGC